MRFSKPMRSYELSPAPIALFVYNRPEHTRRVVASLLDNPLADQSPLHVFCDGPRAGDDGESVKAVRSFVQDIRGFADIEVHEQTRNRGLAESIIFGVDRLCEQYGRAIVVEDDLHLAPNFLVYLNSALDRYRDEPRVMQISGHMFPVEVDVDDDALFLPFTTSWGWGTWASSWKLFDRAAKDYAELKEDHSRRQAFDMNGAYDYFSMLEAQLDGTIDSWAIRWYLSVFMNDGMVLYPKKSLVENTGFDGSGTHTRGKPLDQTVDTDFAPSRLPLPQIDLKTRDQVYAYFQSRRKPITRLRRLAARLVG